MKKRKLALMICLALVMTGLGACNANININTEDGAAGQTDRSSVTEADASENVKTEETAPAADEISEEDTVVLPELKSVPFDMTEYDKDGEHKVFESYGNSYLLSDISARDYPALDAKLKKIDEDEKEFYRQAIDDSREDALEFAEEQRKYGEDYTFFRYSETQLMNADDKVVSMLRMEYGYLGGAHPDYYYETMNIYTKTGEDIPLSDILTDDVKLRSILKERLNKEYPDGNWFDLDSSLDTYVIDDKKTGDDKFAYIFTMNSRGIMFYFNPYDLNSYADGAQQIEISYTDLADIIKPGFVYEDLVKEDLATDAEEGAGGADSGSKNDMAVKAPSFTGLENIRNENNEDGTYFYQDMTQDGLTVITNMCAPNSISSDQAEDAYVKNFIGSQIDKDANVTEMEYDDDLSRLLSLSAYEVEWTSGANEDSKVGKGIVILTDSFTYYYGFSCPLDYFEESEDFYEDELENIEMLKLD